jgi:ketosteroid isomerase-like protein
MMTMTPVDVMKSILNNPKDMDNVRGLTTPEVVYVSLNYSNPELKRVMPWCGTARGPEAIVKTFVDVERFWSIEAFQPEAAFGDDTNAAMFGSFTYRSTVLGKQVTSPFAVFAKVIDGKCTYLQFMEDTLATTESFRTGGKWTIHSDPDGAEIAI